MKYYADDRRNMSPEASVSHFLRKSASILTIQSVSKSLYLGNIPKYWKQLIIPEQETAYCFSEFFGNTELQSLYEKNLCQLNGLMLDSRRITQSIESTLESDVILIKYQDLQKQFHQLIAVCNAIRCLTQEVVNCDLEPQCLLDSIKQLIPEEDFFIALMQECGICDVDARQQLLTYYEQKSNTPKELLLLLLLVGQPVKFSYFPQNFNKLVHEHCNTSFSPPRSFAALFLLQEEWELNRERQITDFFGSKHFVQCILPPNRQNKLFDCYNPSVVYVNQSVLEQELAQQGDLALSMSPRSPSRNLQKSRQSQQPRGSPQSQRSPELATRTVEAQLPHEFYYLALNFNIESAIIDTRYITTDCSAITEFISFYERYGIPLQEQQYINAICQRQGNYLAFKANCENVAGLEQEYTRLYGAFQEALTGNEQKLVKITAELASVINAARSACGRPVQLPAIKTGFDLLLLQYQAEKGSIGREVIAKISHDFAEMAENEERLQDRFLQNAEELQTQKMRFLTIRVDSEKTLNVYKYEQ